MSSAVAVVPVRKERRSRSKSPSASPSSMTLTEGTVDGDRGARRKGTERSGFEAFRGKIRAGKGVGISSKHEAWAKEAFGM